MVAGQCLALPDTVSRRRVTAEACKAHGVAILSNEPEITTVPLHEVENCRMSSTKAYIEPADYLQ